MKSESENAKGGVSSLWDSKVFAWDCFKRWWEWNGFAVGKHRKENESLFAWVFMRDKWGNCSSRYPIWWEAQSYLWFYQWKRSKPTTTSDENPLCALMKETWCLWMMIQDPSMVVTTGRSPMEPVYKLHWNHSWRGNQLHCPSRHHAPPRLDQKWLGLRSIPLTTFPNHHTHFIPACTGAMRAWPSATSLTPFSIIPPPISLIISIPLTTHFWSHSFHFSWT